MDPESIWFDYKISGVEEGENITVLLQYRFGGANGPTLVLEEPSKVELDRTLIKGDSSKMTGAFYEIVKPADEFIGEHQIVFTDVNEKQYKEEFQFQPFLLITEIPDTIRRTDLLMELQGLAEDDYVRVLLTDTSFTGVGIHRLDTIKNNRLVISETDLGKLINGPIHLELIRENERSVKEKTGEGGRISITYGLRRTFFLQD